MLTENFSRRTFLKGSAALSTLLGLGAIGSKAERICSDSVSGVNS